MHGLQGNQKTSSRIIEVPLGSILHVSMVSARENLDTFASHEDNWVSRPFRLVTCNRSEATNSRDDPEVGENGGVGLITRGENILTVVAFEAVSRLRYMLVLAREGWSIRTSVDSITLEMTTSATRTATRYLADIHQAMTGAIRDQVRYGTTRVKYFIRQNHEGAFRKIQHFVVENRRIHVCAS